MWRIGLVLVALCAVLWLVPGCLGGESRHDVDTGGNGTLEGLYLTPAPQTLDLPLDEEFDLNWDYGYLPPATFTVRLESVDPDGTKDPVYTDLEKIAIDHYRLKPTFSLPTRTFLLLTVTGAGQTVRAMYLTEDNGLFGVTTPQAPGEPKGAAEHVVHTR